MRLGDRPRCAVVHHHVRVVDRDVLDPLLERASRIAAHMHHLADEAIGFGDRGLRIVDELRLHESPAFREPLRILRRRGRMCRRSTRASRACSAESVLRTSPVSRNVRSYSGPNR